MHNGNVDHPFHYNMGDIEVIDAIEAWDFGQGFNRGNAIKYIVRAGMKEGSDEIEDLEKAKWYISREIERVKACREDAAEKLEDIGMTRPPGVEMINGYQIGFKWKDEEEPS